MSLRVPLSYEERLIFAVNNYLFHSGILSDFEAVYMDDPENDPPTDEQVAKWKRLKHRSDREKAELRKLLHDEN